MRPRHLPSAVLCAMVALAMASPHAGGGAESPLKELLARVEPRTGVHHGSLVVIPLVLADGVQAKPGQTATRESVRWSTSATAGPLGPVEVRRFGAAEGTAEGVEGAVEAITLVPAGALLVGAPRERILGRPLALVGEERATTRVRGTGSGEPKEDRTSRPGGVVGALAPLEQRKVDFLIGEDDALVDVLLVQNAILGRDPQKATVGDLLGCAEIAADVGKTVRVLAPLATGYGGGAVGHIAFMGLRPVEVIIFREPAAYAAEAPSHHRALAVSVALWEKFYSFEAALTKAPDMQALLRQARRLATDIAEAKSNSITQRTGEAGGGLLRAFGTKGSPKDGEWRPPLVGRFLVDGNGLALHLEAFEEGGALILPTPLTGPESRPTDERPDISSGALTVLYLQRLLERKPKNRNF